MIKRTFSKFSDEYKKLYIQRFKDLEKEFKSLGYDIFLQFGSLLGAIRNGRFIPEDNDIDFGFICKATNIDEIIVELQTLNSYFKAKNMICTGDEHYLGQAHYYADNYDFPFDGWASWFIDDRWHSCFGIKANFSKEYVLPFKKIIFEGKEFNIPQRTEDILLFYYGEWKLEKDIKAAYYEPYTFLKEVKYE